MSISTHYVNYITYEMKIIWNDDFFLSLDPLIMIFANRELAIFFNVK